MKMKSMLKQSSVFLTGYRLLIISLSPLFLSACVTGPAPINQTYLPAPVPNVPPPQNEPYQPPVSPQYSPPTQYTPVQPNDGFAPPPPGYDPSKPQNYSVREENANQQYSGSAAVIDRYDESESITVAMLPNDADNIAAPYGQQQPTDFAYRDETENARETSNTNVIAPPSVSPFGSSTSSPSASPTSSVLPPRPSLNKGLLDTQDTSPAVKALISGAKRDMSSGNTTEAGAKLERALRIEPENGWVWHNLAKVNLNRGKYEQAITMAKKSNHYATDTPSLQRENWRLIGYASEQKGDVRGMQEAYYNEQLIR